MVLIAAIAIMAASAQPYFYVANGSSATYAVFNAATFTSSQSAYLGGAVGGIAVSPDGSTVYTSITYASSVAAVSTASNTLLATVPVGSTPGHMTVSPNGALLYVVNQASNTVSVISTATKTVAATISVGSRPNSIAFSPDSSKAYVTNLWSGTISVIDTSSNSVVGTFNAGSTPTGLAVSPDGSRIYVACQSLNVLNVLDNNGNTVASIPGFTFPVAVALTPDGTKAYVVNQSAGSVSVLNTANNTMAGTIGVGTYPTWVAVSTDGTQAYVTNEYSGNVSIINTQANSVIKSAPSGGFYPIMVATIPGASNPVPPSQQPPPPPPCSFQVSPQNGLSVGPAGGSLTFSVNASAPSCSWTTSGPSWATISPSSGSGSTTVTVTVGVNLGIASLSAPITIAGTTFTLGEGGTTFSGVRVNVGGSSFTDSHGNVWQGDSGKNTTVTMASISGNPDIPAVYQKAAYSSGTLSYSLPVPAGSVTVKLRFAEIYLTQQGQRSMNIYINGALVSPSFDILAHVGANTAYDVVFTGIQSNGTVTIQVAPVSQSSVATLSGIEIY